MAKCAPTFGYWDSNGYLKTERSDPKINDSRRDIKQFINTRPKKALLPRKRSKNRGRMTVVLDLDETLVHSVFLVDVEAKLKKKEKKKEEINSILQAHRDNADILLDDSNGGIAVTLRPGLRIFLRKLSRKFEVVLFTAAEREYAEPLLNFIDPDRKYLPYRLYREHTVKYIGIKYVKDLRILGRNLRRTVLIDNNIMAMRASPDNSILIDDFYGDQDDGQLEIMWSVLTGLDGLPDVRPCLKESLFIRQRIDDILIENTLENSERLSEPNQRNGSYSYIEKRSSRKKIEFVDSKILNVHQGRLSESARNLLCSSF